LRQSGEKEPLSWARRLADWDRRPPAGNTGRRGALPSPKRSFSFAQASGGPSDMTQAI